jgi:hypothetical protein
VGLIVQPRLLPLAQNRGEHPVHDVLRRRGVGQQQHGIPVQRRAVGLIQTANERSRIVRRPVRHRVIL